MEYEAVVASLWSFDRLPDGLQLHQRAHADGAIQADLWLHI